MGGIIRFILIINFLIFFKFHELFSVNLIFERKIDIKILLNESKNENMIIYKSNIKIFLIFYTLNDIFQIIDLEYFYCFQ